MSILLLLLFASVGIVAGLLAGLLGVSGGLVTVPSLLFLFAYLGFPEVNLMHLAIGTSLASMVINALAATMAHHSRGAVIWRLVLVMLPGLVIGSIAGALVVRQLTSYILQDIFGIFACILGVYFLLSRIRAANVSPHLPPGPVLSIIGLLIAGLSNLLGVGGGIMTVPTLLAFRVKMRRAVGTSAATGLVITTVGAIAFLSLGLGKEIISYSVGYLYLPAFIMISIASFLTAPYGARLAHYLPPYVLRKIFALALIVTGLVMIFK